MSVWSSSTCGSVMGFERLAETVASVERVILLAAAPERDRHDTGRGHLEGPHRIPASLSGLAEAGIADSIVAVEARPATRVELERVHRAAFLDALEGFCMSGG